jgi:hypothetical protein
MRTLSAAVVLILISTAAVADGSTLDAAIGGGLGGAAGAAIGNEVGGREGAIAGGALGAAVGTALNADAERGSSYRKTSQRSTPPSHGHPHYRFCPPGQAKKGRC